jgi:hypothetical protein
MWQHQDRIEAGRIDFGETGIRRGGQIIAGACKQK